MLVWDKVNNVGGVLHFNFSLSYNEIYKNDRLCRFTHASACTAIFHIVKICSFFQQNV